MTFKAFKIGLEVDFEVVLSGKAHRVGVKGKRSSFIEYDSQGDKQVEERLLRTHKDAAVSVLQFIKRADLSVDYIGHRFVHGGSHFSKSVFLSESVLEKLQLCIPLAPLHNPISLSVVQECRARFPKIAQYVTFDSVYHTTIPAKAYTYSIPAKVAENISFRKYGFHGLSYSYVSRQTSSFLKISPDNLKIVACHLGTGGSSVCAMKNGQSIDTSMGYSPLTGLVMSTRTGDIDPILTMYLMVAYNYRPDDLIELLNKKSGLLGVSGLSSDIRDIIADFSTQGGEKTRLAFDMYIHRLKKYIGSYVFALEGIDILVFTDDIGVHDWLVREKVCERMDWCGISIDMQVNRSYSGEKSSLISPDDAEVKVLCIPAEEELVIAMEGRKLIEEEQR